MTPAEPTHSPREDIRTELLAIRARIDKALERIDEVPVAPAPIQQPKYLSIADYAARCQVSESTVRAWEKRGLPVTATTPKRVIVQAADAWLEGRTSKLRLVSSEE